MRLVDGSEIVRGHILGTLGYKASVDSPGGVPEGSMVPRSITSVTARRSTSSAKRARASRRWRSYCSRAGGSAGLGPGSVDGLHLGADGRDGWPMQAQTRHRFAAELDIEIVGPLGWLGSGIGEKRIAETCRLRAEHRAGSVTGLAEPDHEIAEDADRVATETLAATPGQRNADLVVRVGRKAGVGKATSAFQTCDCSMNL